MSGIERLIQVFPLPNGEANSFLTRIGEQWPTRSRRLAAPWLASRWSGNERAVRWAKYGIAFPLLFGSAGLLAAASRRFYPHWKITFRWPTSQAEQLLAPLIALYSLYCLSAWGRSSRGNGAALWSIIDAKNDAAVASQFANGQIDPRDRYLADSQRGWWSFLRFGNQELVERVAEYGLTETLGAIALIDLERIRDPERPLLLSVSSRETARLLLHLGAPAEAALRSSRLQKGAKVAILTALGVDLSQLPGRGIYLFPDELERVKAIGTH